jgi:predicted metal-dependent peptidase
MAEETNLSRKVFEETVAIMLSNPTYKQTYMFYGFMVSQCQPIMKDMEAPAAVTFLRDHYVLYINPPMFEKFTVPERLAVIKHEMLHIMNGHLQRCKDRNPLGFNYATDCAINQLIDKAHLPKGCVLPATLPTQEKEVPPLLSAEQYYDMLDIPEDEDGNDNQQVGGMDDHSTWQEAEGDEDLQKDITKGMLESSMNNTQKSRGNLPSNLSEALELFSRKNEVNWRQVLRNIVGNKKANSRRTIMRADRRFPRREDLRGKTKDRTFNLLLIGDESGSVSNEELVGGISEVQNICEMTKTDLDYIAIDTRAHAPIKLKKSQRTFKRVASGGTELNPALEMAKDHNIDFQAVVVITDGGLCDSDVLAFSKIGKKVIWLITSNGHIHDLMEQGRMSAYKLTN